MSTLIHANGSRFLGEATPGPWARTTYNGAEAVGSDTETGGLVARVFPDENGEEQEANARLIAAAPEMYEALRCMLAEYCAREWTDPASGGPATIARGVLARVEGAK